MPKTSQYDLATLEQSHVALHNAAANPQIAPALAQVGYDEAKLQEGKALLATAQNAHNTNRQHNLNATLAYDSFDQKRKALEVAYRNHRKRAKICFEDNPYQLLRLDVHKPYTTAYLPWMDSLKQFYTEVTTNPKVTAALQGLKVSEQALLSTKALLIRVEGLRQTYIDEKGQAQNATQTKNQALNTLQHWMRTFYKVAAIALEDQPQLMESLSKVVRS